MHGKHLLINPNQMGELQIADQDLDGCVNG